MKKRGKMMNRLLKWIARKIMMPYLNNEKERMELMIEVGKEGIEDRELSVEDYHREYDSIQHSVWQIDRIVRWLSNKEEGSYGSFI